VLVLSQDSDMSAESKVLERGIVFVNNSKICALPITYINIASYFTIAPDCSVGGTSTGTITHLVTILLSRTFDSAVK
jgi:hypothetical protein